MLFKSGLQLLSSWILLLSRPFVCLGSTVADPWIDEIWSQTHRKMHTGSKSSYRGYATGHHKSSRRPGKWRTTRECTYEQFWCCCNCDLSGPGPMSMWNNQCPVCTMLRCARCHIATVKIFADRGVSRIASTAPFGSNSAPLKYVCETGTDQILSGRHPRSNQSVIPHPLFNSSTKISTTVRKLEKTTIKEITSLSNIDTPCMDPNILAKIPATMQKEYGTQSAVSSAVSSPRSSETASSFMDGGGTPSTDMEFVDSTDSSDDDTEISSGYTNPTSIVEAIDDCILAACIHSLELATAIILQVHEILGNSSQCGVQSHAGSAQGTAASGNWAGNGSAGGNLGISSRNPGKRGADSGSSSDRPTKQQRVANENGAGEARLPSDLRHPTFACHFCKKDPSRYNYWAGPDSKYKNCQHPSIPHNELRRIKDHFQIHLLSQCDRCYVTFQDKDALVTHRQMPNPCEKRSAALKEGIDDGQWEKIKNIVKKTKQKDHSDVEKWYEIWRVLFGGATPPLTPWSEPGCSSTNTSLDREAIMSEIRGGMENMVEEGMLSRSDQVYERIISVVQSALAIQAPHPVSDMTMFTIATTDLELRGHGRIQLSNGTTMDDASNSINSSSVLQPSNTDLFQDDGTFLFQDQLSWELNMNRNPALGSGYAALGDTASEGWLDVDSMEVPYRETNPHPSIATFGRDPALPNLGRITESGVANSINVAYFDMDAYLATMRDPGSDFDHFESLEGHEEAIGSEPPADLNTTLETELASANTLTSKKDRNRGLKGKCQHGIED